MEVTIDHLSSTSGNNIWSSNQKLIVAKLKFNGLDHVNLYTLSTCMGKAMPSLLDHNHGGLLKELPNNSIKLFISSAIALIAKELQVLAGSHPRFEKGYIINDSLYYAIAEYEDERLGMESMKASVRIMNEIIFGNDTLDIKKILTPLNKILYTQLLKRA